MDAVSGAPGLEAMLEGVMFSLSQLFLVPVLAAISVLFLYAFFAFGVFLRQWLRRRQGNASAYELIEARRLAPDMSLTELEAEAVTRLEFLRIASRIAPLLGLVATMIPMGPALKALGDGQLTDVSHSLMVAFSAVILALLASALTYWIATVRKRWYAVELLQLERDSRGQS